MGKSSVTGWTFCHLQRPELVHTSPTTVFNFGFDSWTTALNFWLGSRTIEFNSGFGSQTIVLNIGLGSRTMAVTSWRSESSNMMDDGPTDGRTE